MTAPDLLWVGAVVALASTVQTAIGFGATLIVVTLGALRVPIAQLLPVLVPLSCLATASIVVTDRAHVDWRLLLGRILPLMAPGCVLGALVADRLAADAARQAYGVLVVVLAATSLWTLRRARADAAAPASGRGAPWIALAGLVHGLYATGGPLLVHAVDRLALSPRAFRGTLAGVWLALNLGLTASFAAQGRVDAGTATCSAALLPALGVGLALGQRVHAGLDARTLRTLVLGLLLVAGAALVRPGA